MLQAMTAQPVVTEIVSRGTKHGVNVKRIVRGSTIVRRDNVVVLDQHSGPVDAIVDGLSRLGRSHPGEMDLVESGSLHRSAIAARDIRPEITQILVYEGFK